MSNISTFRTRLPSWPRILLLIYVIANLKSLPFAWHVRVLYHFWRNASRRAIPPKPSAGPFAACPPTSANSSLSPGEPTILTHPLFQPVSLTTRTPLLESDYNLHKSNSTYFADMDVSRTKLITRLFAPGWRKVDLELEKEGYQGKMFVALGAVHATFKKEVAIYEKVEVRSRVCMWDAKWLVVVSHFVRPKKGAVGEEELCAVGLSKYVFKKGRYTIKPARILQSAGWFPKDFAPYEKRFGNRITGGSSKVVGLESSSPTDKESLAQAEEGVEEGEGLSSRPMPEVAENVVLDEQTMNEAVVADDQTAMRLTQDEKDTRWNPEVWRGADVEKERIRGVKLVRPWLELDSNLYGEFEYR